MKILAKSVKMFAKPLKIWANHLKIQVKMLPNGVWFEKNGAQRLQNHMKTFFLRSFQNKVFIIFVGENICKKICPETLRAKIFRPPKVFLLLHLCPQQPWLDKSFALTSGFQTKVDHPKIVRPPWKNVLDIGKCVVVPGWLQACDHLNLSKSEQQFIFLVETTFSMTANAKCTIEQRSQAFYKIHICLSAGTDSLCSSSLQFEL